MQEPEDGSMEMSGQHLASISDSATDILAVSPETFKLRVLNCWGKLALWLSLPVGTERQFHYFFPLLSEILITVFSSCLEFDQVLFGLSGT